VLYERPTRGGATSVAFRLAVPPGAHLRFGYGLDPDQWVTFTPAAVTFTVTAATAGSEPQRLFGATVDAQRRPAERAWREADVDLTAFGGTEVVLTLLTTTDGPAGERADLAGWAEPGLVVAAPAAAENAPARGGAPE
jgi:hypothetical protein